LSQAGTSRQKCLKANTFHLFEGLEMLKKLLALFIVGFMAACSGAQSLDPAVKDAPKVAGKLLDGAAFNVADNKGNVTVVQFWATWCPTCVKEMPMVQTWYDVNKAKGLKLVSVSIDDSTKEVTEFLAKNPNLKQPIAWVKDVQHNFGRIKGTPTFVVIGKDGKVTNTYVGGIKESQLADIAKML
jgi:thiol-disulfide isomerase/thioredoxin